MFDIFSKLFGGAAGKMGLQGGQALGPNGPVPMGAPMGGPPQMTPGMMQAAGSNFDPAQGGRVGPGMALNPGATMMDNAFGRMGLSQPQVMPTPEGAKSLHGVEQGKWFGPGASIPQNTQRDVGAYARATLPEKPKPMPPGLSAPMAMREPVNPPRPMGGIFAKAGGNQQAQADPQQMQKMGPLFAMLMQRQGGMA